jgi:hypothetical protein
MITLCLQGCVIAQCQAFTGNCVIFKVSFKIPINVPMSNALLIGTLVEQQSGQSGY